MNSNDTEYIFPARLISQLGDMRGEQWVELVEKVTGSEKNTVDEIAFVYMLARINGCGSCNSDAFRAMKGCLLCARHSIKRFRGSDTELVEQFNNAYQEIKDYLDLRVQKISK